MFVIGLAGGICSGKSTLAALLEKRGAAVISADLLAHELYRPGTSTCEQILTAFGGGILKGDGRIDRRKLGRIVFADGAALERLNCIVRLPLKRLIRHNLAKARANGSEVVVLEAAVLVQAGWTDIVNEVWVTVAPLHVVTNRLVKRNGLSRDEAVNRIVSQPPAQQQVFHADVVVDMGCPLEDVGRLAERAWIHLQNRLSVLRHSNEPSLGCEASEA